MANVMGTTGDDVIDIADGVTDQNDNIAALAGNDIVLGLGGSDTIDGAEGNDTLIGGDGNDALFGGDGIDTADYGISHAAVYIDLAANTAVGGDAHGDVFFAVENLVGSVFDDQLTGDVFANRLVGARGNDLLKGAAGNDVLFGGNGTDTLDGGVGNDRLFGDDGDDTIAGGADSDEIYGGIGSDRLEGGNSNDTLDGGAGNDALFGGAGDDILKGFAGADKLDGGDGMDAVDYSESAAGVIVSLADGTGSGGDAEGDTLVGIEWLAGTQFADTLSGNDADNVLVGGVGNDGDDTLNGLAGNDTLIARDGNDILDGGAGIDQMAGGDGNDTYVVDDAGDVVDEAQSTGIDLVQSSISFSLANTDQTKGEVENLTLLGNAEIDGTGNGLANVIVGNGGKNILTGGGGKDTLDGGAGQDRASYEDRTVSVSVTLNGATDATVFVNGVAEDTIRNIEMVSGGSGDDSLTGDAETNDLFGNAGADVLLGFDASDLLDGGDGNDRLSGGTGGDQVTGGAGADAFVFDAAIKPKGVNVDTITDFSSVDDTIILDNAILAKLKTEGVLKGKFFHEGKKAHDGNDRVIYNEKNGALIYDKNGDNKGGAIKFAVLEGSPDDLSRADFFVV